MAGAAMEQRVCVLSIRKPGQGKNEIHTDRIWHQVNVEYQFIGEGLDIDIL